MKRNYILIFAIVLFSFTANKQAYAQLEEAFVNNCSATAGEDATYLKDFVVTLDGAGADEKVPQAKYSLVLSKNTSYRFTICNSDSRPGKGVLSLYDTERLLGSTYQPSTGKEYKSFNFLCQKTGVYHVFISFQEGDPGYAVAILSFVKKL